MAPYKTSYKLPAIFFYPLALSFYQEINIFNKPQSEICIVRQKYK